MLESDRGPRVHACIIDDRSTYIYTARLACVLAVLCVYQSSALHTRRQGRLPELRPKLVTGSSSPSAGPAGA